VTSSVVVLNCDTGKINEYDKSVIENEKKKKYRNIETIMFLHTGWSKKTDTLCFVRLNFSKY